MERTEFIEQFTDASETLLEHTNDIISACIERINQLYPDFPKGHFNCTSAMEELAELTAAISQRMRGRPDDNFDVLQEIGDVLLSILCISKVFGITKEEIYKAVNVKLEREHRKQINPDEEQYKKNGFNSM